MYGPSMNGEVVFDFLAFTILDLQQQRLTVRFTATLLELTSAFVFQVSK